MHKQERYYFIRHNGLYMILYVATYNIPGLANMQMKATAFFLSELHTKTHNKIQKIVPQENS